MLIHPDSTYGIHLLRPRESWWLTRKGRTDEALRSLQRLGNSSENHREKLATIERTVKIEAKLGGSPTLLDLFKGTDRRRTIITCSMYASQNFAGNLIANQVTFFFERKHLILTSRRWRSILTTFSEAGMDHDFSFQLGLINSCLGFVANAGSWFLTAWFGRRTIYLWGTAVNITFLILLGICASITQNSGTNYAQAILGILISFVFAGAMGPISYSIIAEALSVRLRALSTGVGRGAYVSLSFHPEQVDRH
jgi:SP family general alpha glucoside:H+ symporter-like MFS transporter